MPTRKSGAKLPALTDLPQNPGPAKQSRVVTSDTAQGATVSGPSQLQSRRPANWQSTPLEQAGLAEKMPYNKTKAGEYAPADVNTPPQGPHDSMPSPIRTGQAR